MERYSGSASEPPLRAPRPNQPGAGYQLRPRWETEEAERAETAERPRPATNPHRSLTDPLTRGTTVDVNDRISRLDRRRQLDQMKAAESAAPASLVPEQGGETAGPTGANLESAGLLAPVAPAAQPQTIGSAHQEQTAMALIQEAVAPVLAAFPDLEVVVLRAGQPAGRLRHEPSNRPVARQLADLLRDTGPVPPVPPAR